MNPEISVVIPCYNEEFSIEEIVERVKNTKLNKEIIIVDDGSTDGSKEMLNRLGNEGGRIKIIRHYCNQGKGTAIRTALKYVHGNIIIIQDADLELSPSDYPKLIEPILKGKSEIVFGSRLLAGQNKMPFLRLLANKFLTFLTNILYKSSLTDVGTAYKVFNKSVLDSIKLQCSGFEWETEITVKILRLGYKIYEIPVSYSPRTRYDGKKIDWLDGVKVIWALFRYRFVK